MSENTDQQQQQNPPPNSETENKGDQQQQAAYYESFTDEGLKTSPDIQKFKTVEDLARGYTNASKMLGAKPEQILRLPDKMDDPEAMRAIWQKLGGPEKVEGYKFDLSKANDADKAAIGEFAAEMHKAGPYPPGVVETAVKWFQGKVAAQEQALVDEAKRLDDEGQAALKTEWGAAYEQRRTEIGKLIGDVGGEKLVAELNASAFGSNPELAKFLGKLVDKMAEPGPKNDTQNADVGTGKLTPAQAVARSKELETHPAFRDANHPQHRDVVKARNDALRMAQSTA